MTNYRKDLLEEGLTNGLSSANIFSVQRPSFGYAKRRWMIRITKRLVHKEHMALEPFKPPVCACVISLLLFSALYVSWGKKRMVVECRYGC